MALKDHVNHSRYEIIIPLRKNDLGTEENKTTGNLIMDKSLLETEKLYLMESAFTYEGVYGITKQYLRDTLQIHILHRQYLQEV